MNQTAATFAQLRHRVTRVEIAVMGADALSEPVVHECTLDRMNLTDLGVEILHTDDRGYQFVPSGRVVRIDYRMDE